ncbi:MAG: uroporphyrinogen decarboxylase family protein [Planctomycetota bacterium]
MSTPRQRFFDCLDFNSPDKMPVVYHPSPAGLYKHGKKLLDLFNAYPPDNPIAFDKIPTPPPETIAADGRYHQIIRDKWGVDWEYLIFGIAGHPVRYPFNGWDDAKDFVFPPLPSNDPLAYAQLKDAVAAQKRDYITYSGDISIFERIHDLQPFDSVLVDFARRDEGLLAFLDRLVEYWIQSVSDVAGAGYDAIWIGDDWGSQTAPLISPRLFNSVFKPRYREIIETAKRAGLKVFFHSCGMLGYTFNELADMGIDLIWPQIALFEANPAFLELARDRKISLFIHPDRQRLIPQGTPSEIRDAIKRYSDQYHQQGGGGIFYVEIENDAPFENVEALITAIADYR